MIEVPLGIVVYVLMCVFFILSSAGPGSEEEAGGNSRQRHNRHGRDGGAAASLEKRLEELEKVRLQTLSDINGDIILRLTAVLTL